MIILNRYRAQAGRRPVRSSPLGFAAGFDPRVLRGRIRSGEGVRVTTYR